jgi:chromosome segregation ATPase
MAKKKTSRKVQSAAHRPESIEGLVRTGFREVNERLDRVDQRFEQVDQRFEQVDQRFEQVDQRFEQVDQRFEQVDQRFAQSDRRQSVIEFELGELKRQISEQGAALELRIDRLANHVDGFMKLHETLDIEFKVLKEQMNRVEARLDRLEAERTT